ncbi:polysaccharide deacetylase [Flavobacterium noncentrifugens]|uniref:Peptidoglycan/xylan/chitin deacetylase, PgdA/CDA1 family n=2 Tax=Flavobacterium noncentrifugens TaxID=1128970 RepID=A0A1G8SCL3_9FLAO|nr:polysaccharide deacetylase family protein [Flavobacterium noncentrifugens]GEP49779.1 polysaccharide deacetylase [Flavobacterium noncentrifugens]SDJ26972.1 Peptidoglycan/xylan/chitin deacetylase, PgdA/CDA1 family [Flavobacterium noncentrifugens]
MLKHRITALFFLTIIFLLALWGLFAAMSIWYFAIAGLLWFLVVLTGSSYIGSNYHVKTYCSNPDEKERKIALTFDDGPNENTLEILKVLEKHQVKAAFFCIGKNIAAHPEILKKIVAGGHVVANHSYSHSHFIDFYRKDRMIRELTATDAIIEKLTGKKVQFFRPPYGVTNPSIRRALEITKHKTIGWNIRSLDGIISNKKIILNRIVKRISPGAIVLLHDTKRETVDVLEQLLLIAAKKKYEIVSIEQLLNLNAYEN